jgi:hypothetical protein
MAKTSLFNICHDSAKPSRQFKRKNQSIFKVVTPIQTQDDKVNLKGYGEIFFVIAGLIAFSVYLWETYSTENAFLYWWLPVVSIISIACAGYLDRHH